MHDHVPRDTDLEAHRVQMRILRGFGIEKRAQMTFAMSAAAMQRARAALRARQPGASEQEIRLRLIELNYGPDLAARVRARLEGRG